MLDLVDGPENGPAHLIRLESPLCVEEEMPHHFIPAADEAWDKPLHPNAFNLCNHLLHDPPHCNGSGHLILINGREGRSKFIAGHTLMDLWDCICTSLRVWEITVEDVSRKYFLDRPLVHGIAYGSSWFARWGYDFALAATASLNSSTPNSLTTSHPSPSPPPKTMLIIKTVDEG